MLARYRCTVLAAATWLALAGVACGGGGEEAGAAETLVVAAALSEPPGHVGRNTLLITVHDLEGVPVAGATVSAVADMPIHGHGSTEDAEVSEDGDGQYTAWPVTFTMPGPWVVDIEASDPLGAAGSLTLEVQIE